MFNLINIFTYIIVRMTNISVLKNNKYKLLINNSIFQLMRIHYYCLYSKTSVDNVPMFFTETDNKKAKVMFMLHGFPDTKELWKDYVKKYKSNYNVVTVNLPLYSKDEVTPDLKIAYTKEAIEQKLLHQIKKYKNKEIIILAHDCGAVIAINLVQSNPGIVHKLITLDVGYFPLSINIYDTLQYLYLYQWIIVFPFILYHILNINKFNIYYEKYNTFPLNAYLYIPFIYQKYDLKYIENSTNRLFIYGKDKIIMFHKKVPTVPTFFVGGGHWAFFENEDSKNKTFEYIDKFIES